MTTLETFLANPDPTALYIADLEAELTQLRKTAEWSANKILQLVTERNEARRQIHVLTGHYPGAPERTA